MKKKNVIPMLCMSALLAGGVFQGSASLVRAAGTETETAYDAVFKLSNDHIRSVKNNGGNYGSSVLAYLTDGNINTHWETGKANSGSFTNEVVVTFDEPVELGSVVYYPRKNGAANKGFPTQYSIYASESESGDDFQMVTQGSAEVVSGATKLEFEPTSFTRLKFVFDKARQNWAAGGELMFYYPDLLPGKIEKLFSDGTMSALSPEFQDIEMLESLMEQAEVYPDSSLVEKIQKAMDIQKGKVDYTADVFTVEQAGNRQLHSSKIMRTGGYSSNIIPTGYAALAGEQVKIYVDVEDGAPLPSVTFTQQVGKWSNWEKSYKLKQGENIFTVPRIYNKDWSTKVIPGGAIYITNPYTPQNQGAAPKIRIEGAEKYPLFYDGDDEGAFVDTLRAYKAKLDANPDTTVDIVEIYSDKFILNGNMKAAACILNGGNGPQKTVDLHNLRQDQLLSFAGVDDREFVHSRNHARANIRLMQPYGAAYAASGHVGIQQGSANTFFKGALTGWLYSHELGHQLDTREGFVGEVTNNMWANHIAVDVQGEYDRVNYKNIFVKQASDDYRELVKAGGELGMYWQLHLLNENYWPKYQSAYREDLLKNAGLTKNERMAVISCYAVGMDVIEHFERYKFVERNDNIDQALAALNIPKAPENIRPWYLWTKATKDRSSVFGAEYKPEITGLVKNGDNTFTLTASIDASAQQALLGYEVMEDGKVLGFTSGDAFTGKYTDDGRAHSYTIRPYDLRLNTGAVSGAVEKNFKAPVLQTVGSAIVPLGAQFDPLSLVSAKDYQGADISGNICVISSSVNTSVRGIYPVVYEVVDEEGSSAQLSVDVEVVSTVSYLSDMKETSARVGHGSLRKDKSVNGGTITLLRNHTPVAFRKGLGTHASSSVVYDLSGKGYTYFEAFVGIDQAMRGANAANAKFRVIADGSVIYESQAMKAADDAEYVKLNIQNVNTLELVTDSNGANTSDHTVWADARVASVNCAPVIHAENKTFLDPQNANLSQVLQTVAASDVEDGDLTGAIVYDTDFAEGKAGCYTINYSVTDSDGNTASVARKITVVNEFVYATDTDWRHASVGWGKLRKDNAISGKLLQLAVNDGVRSYEKGIGVHAHSEVVYDLTGKDYYFFTSDAGVDVSGATANSSVVFQIYVDGVLVEESPVMKSGMPAVQFCVDISNASELKLVVTNAGNGNTSDHANWADAKFLMIVEEADKEILGQLLAQAGELQEEMYTSKTWQQLQTTQLQAQEIYKYAKATQEETDEAARLLQEALDQLQIKLETQVLEETLAFAERITELSYVDPQLSYREDRLESLKLAAEEVQRQMQGELSQEEVDRLVAALKYFIEDTGQIYEPGTEPKDFTAEPEEGQANQTEQADISRDEGVQSGENEDDAVEMWVVPEEAEESSPEDSVVQPEEAGPSPEEAFQSEGQDDTAQFYTEHEDEFYTEPVQEAAGAEGFGGGAANSGAAVQVDQLFSDF